MTDDQITSLLHRLEFIANETHQAITEEIEEVCDLACLCIRELKAKPTDVEMRMLIAVNLLTACEATFRSHATNPNQWPVYRKVKEFLDDEKATT